MRSSRDLGRLKTQLDRRVLAAIVEVGVRLPEESIESDRCLAVTFIGAHNSWAQFARAYYFSLAAGAIDASGQRVVIGNSAVIGTQSAMTAAIHHMSPKLRSRSGPWSHWDEPRWHNPDIFLQVIINLKPSNESDITKAFAGVPSQKIKDLTTIRNFFCHRGEETARLARDVARRRLVRPLNPNARPIRNQHPRELLRSLPTGRTRNLAVAVLEDLRNLLALLP